MWLSVWSDDKNNSIPHTRDMYLGVYGGLGIAQCNFIVVQIVEFIGLNFFAFFKRFLIFSYELGCRYRLRSCGEIIAQQFAKSNNATTDVFLRLYSTWAYNKSIFQRRGCG